MIGKNFRNGQNILPMGAVVLGTALMAASGCGEKLQQREEKTITVSEFTPVNPKLFNDHLAVSKLTVSRDGKHVYLTVNGDKALYHGDAADLENSWTNIKLATDLDGSVGKAKLETAKNILKISAAKDGALVSVQGEMTAGAPNAIVSKDHGAIYLQGATKSAAWSPNAQDIDAGPIPAPFALPPAVGGPDKLAEDIYFLGSLVNINNNDVPYFFGLNVAMSGAAAAFQLSGVTKADLSSVLVSEMVKRDGTALTTFPNLVAGGDYLFAVDSLGVTTLPKDDIGKAKNFLDVAANTPAATTGVVGSEAFRMKTGVNNQTINAIEVSGNNLYIGLGSAADFEGGVAVYEIKPSGEAPVVKAPQMSWRGIGVSGLIKDDQGKVWAITSNDVLEAKADGNKGDSFFDALPIADKASVDSAKDGYSKASFPRENITGAAFVNGKLVVETTKGLMVVKETKKTILGSKLAEANE